MLSPPAHHCQIFKTPSRDVVVGENTKKSVEKKGKEGGNCITILSRVTENVF